jgi:hypothetical protein
MAGTSEPQLPSDSDAPAPMPGDGPAGTGRAVLAAGLAVAAVLAGTALLGVTAGFTWRAVAPRAVVVVVSRGSADVVDPETTAFIAADGWFAALCLIGGTISGVLGYLFAVRRHGPSAMLGVLAGALGAALIARWIGEQSGAAAFNQLLVVSRPGALLRAPVTLGGVGALAFWPLAAGLTAGGIAAVDYFRDRRRVLDRRSGYAAALPRHSAATSPGPASHPGLAGRHESATCPDPSGQQKLSWPAGHHERGSAEDPRD